MKSIGGVFCAWTSTSTSLALPEILPEFLAGALPSSGLRLLIALGDRAGRGDDEHPGVAGLGVRLGRRLGGQRRQQQVEELFFRLLLGLGIDFVFPLGADQVDRGIDQVAHHGLDVAADVPHLGELRGFDFDERRPGESGQAAGDLGLADAGGADQDDIGRGDLVADVVGRLASAPAVADRDRDGAFGRLLADDVSIELAHDLAGRHLLEPGERLLLGGGFGGGFGHRRSLGRVVGTGGLSRSGGSRTRRSRSGSPGRRRPCPKRRRPSPGCRPWRGRPGGSGRRLTGSTRRSSPASSGSAPRC